VHAHDLQPGVPGGYAVLITEYLGAPWTTLHECADLPIYSEALQAAEHVLMVRCSARSILHKPRCPRPSADLTMEDRIGTAARLARATLKDRKPSAPFLLLRRQSG